MLFKSITVVSLAAMFMLSSCSKHEQAENTQADSLANAKLAMAKSYEYFGDSLTIVDNAISTSDLEAKMQGTAKVEALIKGEITGSCQNKGCWATLKLPNDKNIRVSFKDYGFFLPVKNLEGKELVLKGIGMWDTTTVDALKEEAKEEGKTKKEIEAIKDPIISLAFEASGVALKK